MTRKTIKIGLIAGPGSGKSTTAANVFTHCKRKGIPVALVTEYARELIDSGWAPIHTAEQFMVLKEQRKREDIVPENVKVMITDSPTFLSIFYGIKNSKNAVCEIPVLVSLYEEFLLDAQRYDYLIFLNRVKPYVQDGTRKQSEEESDMISMQLCALMDMHKIPYIEMDGNESAVQEIMKIIYAEVG